jgi:hypothetical protein
MLELCALDYYLLPYLCLRKFNFKLGFFFKFYFIVALCILIYVEFTHQKMGFYYFKEHVKIYIKIDINIAPTYFDLRPSSG